MSTKKRGLGKGLNELLSATLSSFPVAKDKKKGELNNKNDLALQDDKETQTHILRFLPIQELVVSPFQPRQHISHEGLEQLSESIRAQGVLQPIVVRVKEGKYEIVAGERRWRAAQLAGLTDIPAILREVPDEAAMAMALIENIQREDLNPIEEALALKRLVDDLQFTHLQIAEAIGKSRASVTNSLRLLTLNAEVQKMLDQSKLEMGHARALLGLKGALQLQIAQTVFQRGLSVRETERLVAKLQAEPTASTDDEPKKVDPNIRRLEEDLADKLGAKVLIRHGRRGHGMVVIRYHDVDELEGILAHFK